MSKADERALRRVLGERAADAVLGTSARPERKRVRHPQPVTLLVESIFKDPKRPPRTEVIFNNVPGSLEARAMIAKHGIPLHFRVWVREPGEADRVIQQGSALW